MKFGSHEVPEKLFDLARARMRLNQTFTPEEIRTHLLKNARAELELVDKSARNQQIIVNRVTRACINELRESKEIGQFNRGRWAKTSFLNSVRDEGQG